MGKKETTGKAALGLYLTADAIEAVLLREREGKLEIAERFRRQRIKQATLATAGELAHALPGLSKSEDSDYTLEVGDGRSQSAPPLDFGSVEVSERGDAGDSMDVGGRTPAFTAQLRDILEECRNLGYADPALAFCVGSPSVSYLEVQLVEAELSKASGQSAKNDKKKGKDDDAAPLRVPQRKRLIAQIEQQQGALNGRRVGFLPMTPSPGVTRALALITDPAEPVTATLAQLRAQPDAQLPSTFMLEAEASVFGALVSGIVKPQEQEVTVFVRVGATDTLVMFFEGRELTHLERLRSISAYDSPDLVCSRVILQQDERRIAHVNNVIIASSGKWQLLTASFKEFYPDAAIEPLHELVASAAGRMALEQEVIERAPVATAAAAALAYTKGWLDVEETDLLPQQLHRKQRKVRIAWHSVVAVLILAAVSYFAYERFQAGAAQVAEAQADLIANPPPVPLADPAELQARVAELEQTYQTYTRALHVLDSLLVGSDRWVTTMERISNATASTPRTWIDAVEPRGDTTLRITGRSLARLSIVDLARRLSGAIQQLTYQDVGQQRVYFFDMLIPAPKELPRAAIYLRNVEADAQPQGAVELHPARHDH